MAKRAPKQFDVVVIGAGAAGIAAAESARAAGASVCLVEAERVGGECPHWACVPTKAMLRAAVLYHDIRNEAADMGIVTGKVGVRFAGLVGRKNRVVRTVTGEGKRLQHRLAEQGIVIRIGRAIFVDAHTVAVDDERVQATRFVIATGSRDALPPIAGLADVAYLTSRTVVTKLRTLPRSIAIVGGGPVGCEFATLFSLLGAKVTVFEVGDRLLPHDDAEIAALATAALRSRGVVVHESTKVLGVAKHGTQVRLTWQHRQSPRVTERYAAVLVAAGRMPNTDGLGLDALALRRDVRGWLALDGYRRTSQKHIFVIGDAAVGGGLTSMAHHEGTWVGAMAAKGKTRQWPSSPVPRVTFAHPEVAAVGMTEHEARRKYGDIVVARYPVGALSRAVVDGRREGLLKIVLAADNETILGTHMMGERAGEVVHELALAMHAGIPFSTVASMLHAFPTYAEAIPAAAGYLRAA